MKLLLVLTILGFGFISAYNAADIDPQDSVNSVNKVADGDKENPLLKFSIKEGNLTCLMAEFSGEIVGQFTPNVTSTIAVNGTQGEGSHCGEAKETLSVNGYDGSVLNFIFDRSDKNINLNSIRLTMIMANRSLSYESNHTKTLYTVPTGNSFRCDTGISVELIEETDQTSITLTLKSMRFDAFRKTETDEYETSSICSADIKRNKTVPMIIAFGLGGMVVIMLVGYVICRRREDKSVYQSV